ncbi:MAG: spore coat biosynthesis protein F [Chloroflexi bacterium]|jgi:spore coat polysaccharide biosynthesis protein SpsF|nr:spore coat biosynthesis protein F [Chloroflexota bacterium]|tara:strand:- start:8520 stop:9239 length:720 start_codon:yes stop_codon:yes gene_type:complete
MNTVLIIQARMGSTRLPGKSTLNLGGKPLIGWVIHRLKKTSQVDKIVLSTTTKTEDDILEKIGLEYEIDVFRGSENDLVDRYYQAAKKYKANLIVRVPGDNALPEPKEIDRVINYHNNNGNDFSSNFPDVAQHGYPHNGYPDGIGAEVINFEALKRIWDLSSSPRNREHPHTNFYENPKMFKIGVLECPEEIRRPDIILDINTKEQYEFVSEMYEYMTANYIEFGIREVIKWYDNIYKK